MIRGKEAPGQAVDALMDDQQDEDGQKQQEKLPVQKKAAACGDERGIGPRGQGQEGEHDQQGKVAGAGHFGAGGLEGGFALLLGGGELAFAVGHRGPPS